MELPLTGTKLWCVCLKPEENRFMIACEKCTNWYHVDCMGLTKKIANTIPEWVCPQCTQLERVVLQPLQASLVNIMKPIQDSLINVQSKIENVSKLNEFQEIIKKLQSKNIALKDEIKELKAIHQDKLIELQENILKLRSRNSALKTEIKDLDEMKSNKIIELQQTIQKLELNYVEVKKENNELKEMRKNSQQSKEGNSSRKSLSLKRKPASQPQRVSRELSLSEDEFQPKKKK